MTTRRHVSTPDLTRCEHCGEPWPCLIARSTDELLAMIPQAAPTAVQCVECGTDDAANYTDSVREDMIARQLCHSCRFWLDYVAQADNPRIFRVEITPGLPGHYYIGPEDAGPFRGFAGRKFHFIGNDGRDVVSTNVWFQGDIPERFRDRLPVNARLVE